MPAARIEVDVRVERLSGSPAARPVGWYRNAPYLVFFPLGAALTIAGVLPWGLFAFARGPWLPVLHAITEVQGALMAFAIGFLFTFVPRRTSSALPSEAEFFTALTLLFPPPLLALLGHERLAQVAWAALALFLAVFVLRRLPGAFRKGVAVSQLLWLPGSFLLGTSGALMAAIGGGGQPYWLAPLGASMVWQGLLAGLVAGIGGMLLRMLLHRQPHRGNTSALSWWLNGAAFAAFAGSFAVEWLVGMRVGYALRGLSVLAPLWVTTRLWQTPKVAGLHRWSAWIASWLIPLGFLAVAVWPMHRVGMLHLTFLSGFMLLTLSVANHVTIAHGGRDPLLFARPLPLAVMLVAVAVATGARVMVTLDPARMMMWIGTAFLWFLVAIGGWAAWVLPRLKPRPAATDAPIK